ncbi:MAG: AraC family transcriptional regulator, partial [Pseudomonadota bacterium]|nr:AraC family transcriptional regulator [Pseudomonadota bacterium]
MGRLPHNSPEVSDEAMTKTASAAIPVFKLYGESQQWPTPDLL